MFSKLLKNKNNKVNNKKKYILFIALILFLLLGVYQFFAAIKDYSWSREYINVRKDKWFVITQANGRSNPFYIYSLFNQPISLISMINKGESKRIKDNIIYVEDLWARREIGLGTVGEESFYYLINCDTYESGWNSDYSNINKDKIDIKSVKWLSKESEDSHEHYREICDYVNVRAEIEPTIQQQKKLVTMYLNTLPTTKSRVEVFYDLMAP